MSTFSIDVHVDDVVGIYVPHGLFREEPANLFMREGVLYLSSADDVPKDGIGIGVSNLTCGEALDEGFRLAETF